MEERYLADQLALPLLFTGDQCCVYFAALCAICHSPFICGFIDHPHPIDRLNVILLLVLTADHCHAADLVMLVLAFNACH